MLARVFLITLFLLFSISCASHEMTYRLDTDTTAAERAYVIKAMTDWNAETTEDYQMSVAANPDDADWRITFADDIEAAVGVVDGRECRYKGPYCEHAHWVRVRRNLQSDERSIAVVTHELGHSLGLEHVGDPDAIMYAGYVTATHLTGADHAECQRVGPCGSISIRATAPQ